jgi:signal transduction histidine kinase
VTDVDLSSIAAEAVLVARPLLDGHSLTLRAVSDPVMVAADSGRLRQVIDNLMSNALHHTPPGTLITVAVEVTSGLGQLTVSDNGPGMDPGQAARVFERFYRTDQARSRARGGTGLGLSIAAALVEAHGGRSPSTAEPTGNLDEGTRDDIMELLDQLWRDHGLTLILVTHDSSVARGAQRLGIMKKGRLSIRQDSAPAAP